MATDTKTWQDAQNNNNTTVGDIKADHAKIVAAQLRLSTDQHTASAMSGFGNSSNVAQSASNDLPGAISNLKDHPAAGVGTFADGVVHGIGSELSNPLVDILIGALSAFAVAARSITHRMHR